MYAIYSLYIVLLVKKLWIKFFCHFVQDKIFNKIFTNYGTVTNIQCYTDTWRRWALESWLDLGRGLRWSV